jgi:hypothetical protein
MKLVEKLLIKFESKPLVGDTYKKLKDMSLIALKGYARKVGMTNLSDLTDEETALDEIMGFLYDDNWERDLMKLGVL